MSTINDTDLILVNRGGTSYRITMGDFDSLQDTDLILVNRGGTSYKVTKGQTSKILDTDLLFLNRGGTSYKVVGVDFNDKVATTDIIISQLDSTLTFASNKYLGNFLGNQAVKQDAPVTPVTSTITSVVDGAWANNSNQVNYLTQVNSIIYADSKFVCCAKQGSSARRFAYSTDMGANWTTVTDQGIPSGYWTGLAYGAGKYVSCSSSAQRFIYSTDAITWTIPTQTDNNTGKSWTGICYGGGKFVAVSTSGTAAYSTDGIQFTAVDLNSIGAMNLLSVTYANGKYVAVGYSGYGAYSTDAINWTKVTTPSGDWKAVTYGNGKFVAVANGSSSSTTDKVMYSSNGTSWTAATAPANRWTAVAFGDNMFVAVCKAGTSPLPGMYSTDGINWTSMEISPDSSGVDWTAVTEGNGKWIAVGASGSVTTSLGATGNFNLNFSNNTQLSNFQVGDAVTETSGNGTGTVSAVGATSLTLDPYGGTWSNGSTATGVLIDGAGTVASTDTGSNTMTLQSPIERFAIGSKVVPA